MNRKKIVITAAAVLAVCAVAAAAFSSDYFRERVSGLTSGTSDPESVVMNKDRLTEYRYSKSGDMRGSRYSETVKPDGSGRAVLSIASSEWYGEDEKTEEYFVDGKILDDLGDVFREYKMNWWKSGRISRMFVADGASMSYSFSFGEKDYDFSSQYYPDRYTDGLNALDEVIARYRKDGERIPGLVVPEKEDTEERIPADSPTPGVISFQVFKYCNHVIHCRLLNGTEETVGFTDVFTLFNEDTGEEIPVNNSPYAFSMDVYRNGSRDFTAELDSFLEPGKYRIEAEGYSAVFEIR